MKFLINENQFDRVLQKYLDKIQKEYLGKVCRMEVDGYDEDELFWVMIVISQDWVDENDSNDDFWVEVFDLKKEIKRELKTIFSGINFHIGSYVGNC